MRLYLFIINGKPYARTELHLAQAVVEDHLRERRDVSDVWWDDENPCIPRVYLYGGSHSDYVAAEEADEDADVSWEQEEQLIFPTQLHFEPPRSMTGGLVDLPAVMLSLTVVAPEEKLDYSRTVPLSVWDESALSRKSAVLAMFAVDAARAIGNRLTPKEGP